MFIDMNKYHVASDVTFKDCQIKVFDSCDNSHLKDDIDLMTAQWDKVIQYLVNHCADQISREYKPYDDKSAYTIFSDSHTITSFPDTPEDKERLHREYYDNGIKVYTKFMNDNNIHNPRGNWKIKEITYIIDEGVARYFMLHMYDNDCDYTHDSDPVVNCMVCINDGRIDPCCMSISYPLPEDRFYFNLFNYGKIVK